MAKTRDGKFFCNCNQGRMVCACKSENGCAPYELLPDEVRQNLILLSIRRRASIHVRLREKSENDRLTRQWRSRLFFVTGRIGREKFWDGDLALQARLSYIKAKAEIYRDANPKSPARFEMTLHKMLPDILVKNHVFKLMCVELGGWK